MVRGVRCVGYSMGSACDWGGLVGLGHGICTMCGMCSGLCTGGGGANEAGTPAWVGIRTGTLADPSVFWILLNRPEQNTRAPPLL